MADGTSLLRVHAMTALGAYPVPDATVTVSTSPSGDSPPTLLYSVQTNAGGMTVAMELPTPPLSNSLNPDAGQPYALYTVEVSHPGYVPIIAQNVPLFSGVPAVLPAILMPLPETESSAPPDVTSIGNVQQLSAITPQTYRTKEGS